MGLLNGKTALITGASSGIGEATALAFAAEGANVALAARRTDRINALADKLGDQAIALELDVTDEGQCRNAVAATASAFDGLDLVINNAGVMLLGKIEGADTEDWRRMINTNVLGLMYVTHAALPHLLESKGSLVNISSVAGRVARLGSGGYNASKWAVNAFSESLRQEVTARGVRVILIEPGMTATELGDHITDAAAKAGLAQRRETMTPLEADDIAKAILYAVSQPAYVAVNEILIRPTDQEQ